MRKHRTKRRRPGRRRDKRGPLVSEEYRCQTCAYLRLIHRLSAKEKDHPKHMWCPRCRGRKKFVKTPEGLHETLAVMAGAEPKTSRGRRQPVTQPFVLARPSVVGPPGD
ncbi:MAG: hypothetical protein AB1491_00310 [Thermodesulfobacteriota bacterium]